jgi:2-dehydro-3-deoxygalactonokinase
MYPHPPMRPISPPACDSFHCRTAARSRSFPGFAIPVQRPPDVMRGEETQLVGFGLDRPQTIVLPGTHAKWARVGEGSIQAFQTFVTGEVFGTLSRYSFLSKVARPGPAPNWEAFRRGAELALANGRSAAGLLARLFAVRSGWLAGKLDPADMTDYLSGLVVASEFVEARKAGWYSTGDVVAIIGGDDLVEVYRRTAEIMGVAPVVGPDDAALRGVLEIARIYASGSQVGSTVSGRPLLAEGFVRSVRALIEPQRVERSTLVPVGVVLETSTEESFAASQ